MMTSGQLISLLPGKLEVQGYATGGALLQQSLHGEARQQAGLAMV